MNKKVAKEPLGYAPLRLEHYYTPYEAGCKDFFYLKLSDNLLICGFIFYCLIVFLFSVSSNSLTAAFRILKHR